MASKLVAHVTEGIPSVHAKFQLVKNYTVPRKITMAATYLQFEFGEQEVVQGTHIQRVWRMVDVCDTFLGQKPLGFGRIIWRSIVVQEEKILSHRCVNSVVGSSLVYRFVSKATDNSNDGLLSMQRLYEQCFCLFVLWWPLLGKSSTSILLNLNSLYQQYTLYDR